MSEVTGKIKTLQECADIMAQHLFDQKWRCRKGNACVYFNKETGNKCVFGALIPEDKYDPSFEKKTVIDLETNNVGLLCSFGLPNNPEALDFFMKAQEIHDEMWEERNQCFQSLCEEFGLQYNVKTEEKE